MSRNLILFVCTGNVCRSPMAEYLFRERAGVNSPWTAKSAGTMAGAGLPASEAAVLALAERGIDLTSHLSRPLTAELVDAARLIVVMTRDHLGEVRSFLSTADEKAFLLKHFDPAAGGGNIEDPIGLSLESYRRVRDEIDAAMDGLVSFTWQLPRRGGGDEDSVGR